MLKSDKNDEVCDATNADSSTKADYMNKNHNCQSLTIKKGINDLSSPFGGQGA